MHSLTTAQGVEGAKVVGVVKSLWVEGRLTAAEGAELDRAGYLLSAGSTTSGDLWNDCGRRGYDCMGVVVLSLWRSVGRFCCDNCELFVILVKFQFSASCKIIELKFYWKL